MSVKGRSYLEQMSQLFAQGKQIASVAEVMDKRIYSEDEHHKTVWYDTRDAFAYHPDGRVKVVLDATVAFGRSKKYTPWGGLQLDEQGYEELKGREFTRKELPQKLGVDLSRFESKQHPLWNIFARENARLNAYTEVFFSAIGREYRDTSGMSISISPQIPIVPCIRPVTITGFFKAGSEVHDFSDLDDPEGNNILVIPSYP